MQSEVETATGAVMHILTSVVSVSPSTALQLLLAQQQLEGQQQLQGGQQQHQLPRARGSAGMPSGTHKQQALKVYTCTHIRSMHCQTFL